jgi:hypothetical protein
MTLKRKVAGPNADPAPNLLAVVRIVGTWGEYKSVAFRRGFKPP